MLLQFEVSGATSASQIVRLSVKVNDGTESVNLVDKGGHAVSFPLKGNSKFSRNFYGVNTASLTVVIEPLGTCYGDLTITAYQP